LKQRSSNAARFALQGVAFAAACLAGSQAWALGLGKLNVQSALGEQLRAEIDVTSITPEEASSLKLRIAPPEAYRLAGVDYNAVLPATQVQIVKRPDGRSVLRVSSDGSAPIDIVPESFARWRLPPGNRRLTVAWPEGSAILDIDGAAGDVVFIEVIGSVWIWGSNYRLERGDAVESRQRATPLRLVADVG